MYPFLCVSKEGGNYLDLFLVLVKTPDYFDDIPLTEPYSNIFKADRRFRT